MPIICSVLESSRKTPGWIISWLAYDLTETSINEIDPQECIQRSIRIVRSVHQATSTPRRLVIVPTMPKTTEIEISAETVVAVSIFNVKGNERGRGCAFDLHLSMNYQSFLWETNPLCIILAVQVVINSISRSSLLKSSWKNEKEVGVGCDQIMSTMPRDMLSVLQCVTTDELWFSYYYERSQMKKPHFLTRVWILLEQ